jgi:hypothetical protein
VLYIDACSRVLMPLRLSRGSSASSHTVAGEARILATGPRGGPFMTDPNPDLGPDEVEQANVAAAAITGFTLAQFTFGELIKSGILARGDAEHLLS